MESEVFKGLLNVKNASYNFTNIAKMPLINNNFILS